MPDLPRLCARAINVSRRLRAGLGLHPESVSPVARNDLFQAHASIYEFFAGFARGSRVLDVGSGSGYGAAILLARGAREVIGFDSDPRATRFAARAFEQEGLRFLVGDAESFPPDLGVFDVAVSSNVFEHLEEPEAALAQVVAHLTSSGVFAMAVPPIVDAASLVANQAIRFHRNHLTVWHWYDCLSALFGDVRTFRQLPPPGQSIDFTSPYPSRVEPHDFAFQEHAPEDLGRHFAIGAAFVCHDPISRSSSDSTQSP